jgi:hypothetical protein
MRSMVEGVIRTRRSRSAHGELQQLDGVEVLHAAPHALVV